MYYRCITHYIKPRAIMHLIEEDVLRGTGRYLQSQYLNIFIKFRLEDRWNSLFV